MSAPGSRSIPTMAGAALIALFSLLRSKKNKAQKPKNKPKATNIETLLIFPDPPSDLDKNKTTRPGDTKGHDCLGCSAKAQAQVSSQTHQNKR